MDFQDPEAAAPVLAFILVMAFFVVWIFVCVPLITVGL